MITAYCKVKQNNKLRLSFWRPYNSLRFDFPYSEELTTYIDSGTNHYKSTLCTTTDQEA